MLYVWGAYDIQFPANKGYNDLALQEDIEISTDNTKTNWKISGLPDWLNVSNTSGNKSENVLLTAKNNTTVNPRSAVLKVTSSDMPGSYEFNVYQEAGDPEAIASPDDLYFTGLGNTQSVNIVSNCEWYPECDKSWVTCEKKSDTELSITVGANSEGWERYAVVYLSNKSDGRGAGHIEVRQSEPKVTGPEYLTFNSAGGKQQVEIVSDAPWTVETSRSFLTVSPESGDGGKNILTITADENSDYYDRDGVVTVYIGNRERLRIYVTQSGKSWE